VGTTLGTGGQPNGAAVVGTTDGGARWSNLPIPATVAFAAAVACSGPRQCVVVGQSQSAQAVAVTTADGGASWSPASVPTGLGDLSAVTCQPGGSCMALGSGPAGVAALVSTDGGVSWTQAGTVGAGVTGISGVDCVGSVGCWAVGRTAAAGGHTAGVVVGTANGGATWTVVPTPAGVGSLDGVWCGAGSAVGVGAVPAGSPVGVAGVRCTVVGTTATVSTSPRTGNGVVLTTADGGATWTDQPVPATVAQLLGVSCIGASACLAVGNSPAASTTAGVTLATGSPAQPWAQAVAVASPQPLAGVWCVSGSHCVAVGEAMAAHLAAG
jgi:hypothetical protein